MFRAASCVPMIVAKFHLFRRPTLSTAIIAMKAFILLKNNNLLADSFLEAKSCDFGPVMNGFGMATMKPIGPAGRLQVFVATVPGCGEFAVTPVLAVFLRVHA